MSKKSQKSQRVLGNTSKNPKRPKDSDRLRRYCFTLNNWTPEELSHITQTFEKWKCLYIMGKEVGEECGTPHLQGYVEFRVQKKFTVMKKLNRRIRWKICDGNRESNLKYCSKDFDFVSNMKVPIDKRKAILRAEYLNIQWKPWQQKVLDIIKDTPNRRTVNWFWEDSGNVGKSFLARYLGLRYDCIICDGKKDNVFNQIKIWDEKNPHLLAPDLILLDIPRSYHDSQISYGCIEKIKDGQLYSGKYEGGQIYLAPVHVICFANQPPETDKLSEDRWNIVEITN